MSYKLKINNTNIALGNPNVRQGENQLSYRGKEKKVTTISGNIVTQKVVNKNIGSHTINNSNIRRDEGFEEDEQEQYYYQGNMQNSMNPHMNNQNERIQQMSAGINHQVPTNSNKIFNPASNPGHHKANSMQISSKYNVQQLFEQQQAIQANTNAANSNIASQNNFLGFKLKNEPLNNFQKLQKRDQKSKNSQEMRKNPQIYEQKQPIFKLSDQIQILEDSQSVVVASGNNTPAEGKGHNLLPKSKKLVMKAQSPQMPIIQSLNQQKNQNIIVSQNGLKSKDQNQENKKISDHQILQVGIVQVGHKKSNSIQNQRMMQLIMNKEVQQQNPNTQLQQIINKQQPQILKTQQFIDGSQKIVKNQQVGNTKIIAQSFQINNNQLAQETEIQETNYLQQQPHHMKSKSFMHNDLPEDAHKISQKTPNSYKQAKGKANNLLMNEQQYLMNNIIMTSKQNLNNDQKQIIYTDKGKKPINGVSIKPKIGSSSFDKTNSQPNGPNQQIRTQKLGIKQQSFQNKPIVKLQNNYVGQTNTIGLPAPGFISSKIQTAQVSGAHSIITTSQAKLEKSINQPQQILIMSKAVQGGHQRNNSDANYIQNLQNNSKNNFVISTSNHYKQSKKASNLKSMSSNSNHQVSSQGATKGLLNKLNQNQLENSNKSGKAAGHKKNQYSTIVKSNYKNLVDGDEVYNDEQEKIYNQIDLDVFNSNQNKTTEQKYAELKLKYNDLLNKHLYLAAQKTEDNTRPSIKVTKTTQKQSIQQSHKQRQAPIPLFQHQVSKTQKQTIEDSQMELNESDQIYGDQHENQQYVIHNTEQVQREANHRYSDLDHGQKYDHIGISINDQNEEQASSPRNEDEQLNSLSASQNQTPREIRQTYDYQRKMVKNHQQSPNDHRQSASQQISSGNLNQYQIQMQANIETQNSRMEAHTPIGGAQNFTEDDGKINLNKFTKGHKQQNTYAGVSHKRSVSDGIFNNILSKKKYQKFQIQEQSSSIDNEPKASIHTYNQQIPLKQQNKSGDNFDNKIKHMRMQNDIHQVNQQQLAPSNNNVEILGDNEQIIEEQEQIDSNNFSQQEENLVTDQGQEHDFDGEVVDVYDDSDNQNQPNKMYYINEINHLRESQLNSQFAMIIEENSPDNQYSNNNSVETEKSEQIHFQFKNEIKTKKKKSIGAKKIDKIQNVDGDQQISDTDMNKLAKKYKQMRKNGEYTAGLSSDASNGIRPLILSKGNGINETTKASGQISDRFGPVDVMQKRQQPLLEGMNKSAHRRVKSGVPDPSFKMPIYQQRGKNQAQAIVDTNEHGQQVYFIQQSQSNVPSSGQRSLKSLKNNEKPRPQKTKKVQPDSDISKKNKSINKNFMNINEEKPRGDLFNNTNKYSKNTSLFQGGHNGSHESLNKKVINVSYNDFNQSISNDCDDIEQENYQQVQEVVGSENMVVKQVAQNLSSNKNLNNFLEALSKIKPQSAMLTQNSPKEKISKYQENNSPKIISQGQKIKKPNKSEIPGGFTDQHRLQKYQKMMQKVKASEKIKQQNEVSIKAKPGHQRIKSTNDGLVYNSNMFGGMGIKKNQDKNQKGMAGQYTPQGIDPNQNREHEKIFGAPENQNDSQKNLKITFIGDDALLKQHQKLKNLPNKSIQQKQPYNYKQTHQKQIQFHQNPMNFIQSASGSNTGGQPSPIISTKRVPQKILAQNGDSSLSPPGVSYNKILKNNFVKNQVDVETKIQKGQKKKIIPTQSNDKFKNNHKYEQDHQIISDLDESLNFSPIDNSGGHHKLIQNLNKGNYKQNQNQMNILGTPISNSDNQSEQIHIIKHPITSKTNQKISDFNLIGQIVNQSFHNTNAQVILPQAPQVSERMNTEESTMLPGGVNGEMTPRSKQIRKLIKQIRLSFRLQNVGPQTTIDFYRIGKILGKGAFGKVNLAVHKVTECLCAVKSINKQHFSDPSQSKKVMQEVVMLKKTRHQNIVRLYEYFETEKHILFVIELCAGGDLLNYVRRRRRLKEDVAKCLFKQIIESLAYCHKKNILHRDIKLDNILLDANGQVKICDFGVGKIVKKGEKMTEQCGTPAYIAPEILRDEGYYGYAVDIWSSGVVLYAMLYGTVPFKANNMSELQKLIMRAKYTLKDDITQEARDLLKGLMEKDPQKRMTISKILKHPWLEDAKESSQIELFTDQEKQYIKAEYSYNKSKRQNRNFENGGGLNGTNIVSDPLGGPSTCGELDKDMFTEHQLDSVQNSILKNCETKSVILAPFNSTKSNLQLDENGNCPNFELSDSIKELIEDRKIIKFGARVRDIDRQYEINNNADLDNGVYHKFDEDEEENKEEVENQSSESSEGKEEDPQNGDVEPLDEEEQEIMKQLKKQGKQKEKAGKKKQNKQTELQKLEDMIQDQEQKDNVEKNIISGEDDGGGNLVTENSQQPSIQFDQADSLDQNNYFTPQPGNVNDLKLPNGGQNTEESIYSPVTQTDKFLHDLYQQQLLAENITLEETIIQMVELFGYPKEYILKGLNNHDLNYATTAYLLLHFQKKMIETQNNLNRMNIIENTNIDADGQIYYKNALNSGRNSAKSIAEGRSQNNGSKSIPDMN